MDLFCCFLLITYQLFLVCALWYPPQRIVWADACWVLCLDDVFLVASTFCCSLWYLYSLVLKLFYCLYMLLIPKCTYWTLQHVISTHLTSTAPLQILRIRPEIQSNPCYISVFCSFGSHLTSVEFLFFSQECILSFFCVFSGLCKSASCNVQIGVLLCAHMLEGRFNKLGS